MWLRVVLKGAIIIHGTIGVVFVDFFVRCESAILFHKATCKLLWYSNYGTSDPGGSRARGRARARAEQPTWAHRVRYRELDPLGMFRRKSLSEPRLRKIPSRHTNRLEELTDLKQHLPSLSPAGF